MAQNLLKTIVDHTDSNNIYEMYSLLDQSCFKRYATEDLKESVVASMSQLIKKSYTYEKIQFLTHNYTKQYIMPETRRAIIESLVDPELPTDNSSLNKLFFEICNQQELENICQKIKKKNVDFAESFLSWAIESIKSNFYDTEPIVYMLENNDSAKIFIANKAYNILSCHLNSSSSSGYSEIKEIMDAFPWVFSDKDKELMNGWKEGIDNVKGETIKSVKQKLYNSFYEKSEKGMGIIIAKLGVVIRKEPNEKSQKVGSFAYKKKVKIINYNGPTQTIEGIYCNWYKVTDGEVTGWCFGGFVSIINK